MVAVLEGRGVQSAGIPFRRHQTCYFRKRATSAPAEFGGEFHDVSRNRAGTPTSREISRNRNRNVSRNRARTQVLPQAQKSRVCESGEFGAFEPRLAQDKGGPSKGGFLNHRLFSYAVLYLCSEINGIKIIYHSGKQ